MAVDYSRIIDKYYPAGSGLRDIYLRHCSAVAQEALDIMARKRLQLDVEDVRAAAMLHDIGIYATSAPSIECHGEEHYIRHGIIGAELLRSEGVPEKIARVAERHTGSGITAREVVAQGLPLPEADYLPETLLEKLICYADKFYSKSGSMERKSLLQVRRGMARFGQSSVDRFEELQAKFG